MGQAREAWIKEADRLAFGSNGNHLLARSDRDKYDIVFGALIAHLRTTPEGYVLVPVDPTIAILACIEIEWLANGSARTNYASLIAAAQEGK